MWKRLKSHVNEFKYALIKGNEIILFNANDNKPRFADSTNTDFLRNIGAEIIDNILYKVWLRSDNMVRINERDYSSLINKIES